MAKAFRCDSCGDFFQRGYESEYFKNNTFFIYKGRPSGGDIINKECDLCDECLKGLSALMDESIVFSLRDAYQHLRYDHYIDKTDDVIATEVIHAE